MLEIILKMLHNPNRKNQLITVKTGYVFQSQSMLSVIRQDKHAECKVTDRSKSV